MSTGHNICTLMQMFGVKHSVHVTTFLVYFLNVFIGSLKSKEGQMLD